MRQKLYYLLFLAFLAATIYTAQGVPYQYFTNHERTSLGENIRFYGDDTLAGAVRTNDTIRIIQSPVFYDYVVSLSCHIEQNFGFPQFQFDPILCAPELQTVDVAAWARERAELQGHFFDNGTFTRARVIFDDHNLRITWGTDDEPFDTSYFNYPLPDSAIVFFDCPVQVSGTVHTVLIFGATGDIGLEDDVRYPLSNPGNGLIGEGETAKLALISEGSILVLNTWANGRDNMAQGSNIVINALLIALNGINSSFTFENQNDAGDEFQGPTPDERGQIFLSGAVLQSRRNYVHRSNHGGTGYDKAYRYDERLRYWQLPLFQNPAFELDPEFLDFDTVLVDSIVYDSVQIVLDSAALIDIPLDSIPPFTTADRIYLFDSTFYLPVRFTAAEIGEYQDELEFYIEGNLFTVPVRAVVEFSSSSSSDFIPHPSSLILSCFPNPFNPVTTIRFDLPVAARVALDVFNIEGRKVTAVAGRHYNAGTHSIEFDGSGLSTGLYIARLQAGDIVQTTKLLLVK